MASFVVSQFATFSEQLNDDQIESLDDTATWSFSMFHVSGSLTMTTAAANLATMAVAASPVVTMNTGAS